MRFRDIIGQEDVKRKLILTAQQGRVPHAQLFAGKQGVGKFQLAIAYAQYLNCQNPTDRDSCGICPTCQQFEKLQHPDLHFTFPVVKTDTADTCDGFMDGFRQLVLQKRYFSLDDWNNQLGIENKQAVIYEKESGEILRKLSLKAFGSGYKVMIIWQPEKMNIACANKLLKLLEEPPEKTLFFLVSEYPERLLPTILSRVQLIRVPPLPQQQISQALAEKGVSQQTAGDIAHIAQGSFYQALQLVENKEQERSFFDDFVSLMRWAWLVGHRKDYDALLRLRQWSLKMADSKVGREKQKAFLQFVQKQIRENFIYNYHTPQLNYQMPPESDFSRNFAAFIHSGNVEKIIAELDRAERQISQNGNAKIIFFDLCLQMIVLIKK
ncbi:MAG: DNA polymerase III subunit delta' [Paludibacteraceae bacterium]|nr:DNA polymerase III subunit delta' [Paludibacteraceae bacterium]